MGGSNLGGLGHGLARTGRQGLAVAPCLPGESQGRMGSWHMSCALRWVLRPFLQGADAAGGGLSAEPEAEGGLRGAGGTAEPKPGCAEDIPGKWGAGEGLGAGWSRQPGRERVPGGSPTPHWWPRGVGGCSQRSSCPADTVPAAADDGEPGDRQGPGGDRILPSGIAPRAGSSRASALSWLSPTPRRPLGSQLRGWRRAKGSG